MSWGVPNWWGRASLGIALVLLGLIGTARAQETGPLRVFTVAGGRGVVNYAPPSDGMPATTAYVGVVDLAPTSDGGFVLSDPFAIYRVDPLGRVARVAGGSQRQGYSGDGGPARDGSFNAIGDVAVTNDGGLLIADSFNCVVRYVDSSGAITTVAGHRRATCGTSVVPPGSDIGDGGPATSATLSHPSGVSPTPEGGFLIVDSANQRIRRVDPSGTIRTVVGDGVQGEPAADGYGRPAAEASVRNPSEIAALPDGGFLFKDESGLHRVSGDGTLFGVLRSRASRISEQIGLTEAGVPYRFRPGPNTLRVFGLSPFDLALTAPVASFFEGDGDPLRKPVFLRSGFSEIEQTAEGGLLIATPEMVKLAAPFGTRTLAVAVARESLPLLSHRRLQVRSTRPATVQMTLRRRRAPVLSLTVAAARGLTTIRLPRKLPPGPYFVRLRASTPEGAVAVDRLAVLIGSRLPTPIGRAAHKGSYYDRFDATSYRSALRGARSAGEGEDIPLVKRCHRFNSRRVDCIVGDVLVYEDRVRPCLWVGAATLSRNGYIYTRPYGCPRRRLRMPFKRNPRWSAPARESAPLSALLD